MPSTQRFASLDEYPRRKQGGRWLCRWCGVPCPPRRSSYCSDPCAREVAIRTTNTGLRYYTFDRDHGRCTDCKLDAEWLRTELRKLRKQDRPRWLVQVRALGFTRQEALRSIWEADHILPVNAGGGTCGLINIQTRCIRCHKAKTARDRMTTKPKKKPRKLVKGVTVRETTLRPPGPRKVTHTPAPAMKVPRPTAFREKGLWLSAMSVRVEDVKKSHKTDCIDCGKPPRQRRLKVTRGAGRSATTEVYCDACGLQFLGRMKEEADNAEVYLGGPIDDGSAEQPIRVADDQFERVKATHKARAEERKRKREQKARAS